MKYNLENLLKLRHFEPLSVGFSYKAYSRDTGLIRRFLAPDIQTRPYGKVLLGTIGIVIIEFENSWRRINVQKPKFNTPAISTYMTNIYDLQLSEPLHPGEEEKDVGWIEKIEKHINQLPATSDDLILMLQENRSRVINHNGIPLGINRKKAD
ncbi:MAG: hypothetical protein QM661_15220 [Solimonas sp.]